MVFVSDWFVVLLFAVRCARACAAASITIRSRCAGVACWAAFAAARTAALAGSMAGRENCGGGDGALNLGGGGAAARCFPASNALFTSVSLFVMPLWASLVFVEGALNFGGDGIDRSSSPIFSSF